MTMFIKLENGNPVGHAVTEDNLRYLFPGQFPNPHIFTPADVEPLGFGMYEFTKVPTPEYPLKAVETTPAKRDNGIYYQTWIIQEMSEEEKAEATNTQQVFIRNERDFKLMRSDWTQLADAPITDEQKASWNVYRQDLRDVPQQEGFPWLIVWPNLPV